MKEDFYPLYKTLKRSKDFILPITTDNERYYTLKIKPKMKFGQYEEGESNRIRLRHLVPPVRSLKLMQQTICAALQKEALPDGMYGAVAESNNIQNALQHILNNFFLTIDLKIFFRNITNTQVHQVFLTCGYPWEIARIRTKLTTCKGSLPQGAPTSPILANLSFVKTAKQLQDFIRQQQIVFATFLDDLTYSSKRNFRHLIQPILVIIRDNHFFPHQKKYTTVEIFVK